MDKIQDPVPSSSPPPPPSKPATSTTSTFTDDSLFEEFANKQAELQAELDLSLAAKNTAITDRDQAASRLAQVRNLMGIAHDKGIINEDTLQLVDSIASGDITPTEDDITTVLSIKKRVVNFTSSSSSSEDSEYVPTDQELGQLSSTYTSESATTTLSSSSSRDIARSSSKMKLKEKSTPVPSVPATNDSDHETLINNLLERTLAMWSEPASPWMERLINVMARPDMVKKFFAEGETRRQYDATVAVLAKQKMAESNAKCKKAEEATCKLENTYASVLKDIQGLRNDIRADKDKVIDTTPIKYAVGRSIQRRLIEVLSLPALSTVRDTLAVLKMLTFEAEVSSMKVQAKNVIKQIVEKAPRRWALNELREINVSIFDKKYRQVARSMWKQSDSFLPPDSMKLRLPWGNVVNIDLMANGFVTLGTNQFVPFARQAESIGASSSLSTVGAPRAHSSRIDPEMLPEFQNSDENEDSSSSSSGSSSDSSDDSSDDDQEMSQDINWHAPFHVPENIQSDDEPMLINNAQQTSPRTPPPTTSTQQTTQMASSGKNESIQGKSVADCLKLILQ